MQRRHQKLIEEAPSPAVTPALRQRMGEIAIAAVKSIHYEGAGTLEFLLDEAGEFYFMEMNTRLQVEHPVTEAITGLDLVAMQVRVAAGEALSLSQADVVFNGHAIEVRLCAEDASQSFLPQSGTLVRWRAGEELRVEHALSAGIEIAPFYDSMIAKIISHGDTREEARRKLIRGLAKTVALGVTTNQSFLSRCLAHPIFADGGATTSFIEANSKALFDVDPKIETLAFAIAAMIFRTAESKHMISERRLTNSFPASMRLEMNGQLSAATVTEHKGRRFNVASKETTCEIELIGISQDVARFICEGVDERVIFHRDSVDLDMRYAGNYFKFVDQTLAAPLPLEEKSGDGKIRASMNGRVAGVLVALGDDVVAGQPMIVLEAMKMEHVHRAATAGKVTALSAAVDDQVAARRVIAEVNA